jgi:TRAP-type C4-dicarboxylate transport system substrate-binding protein
MKLTKIGRLGLAAATIAVLTLAGGCAASNGEEGETPEAGGEESFAPVTLRWGHTFPEGGPFAEGANKVAELVGERTDGRVTIEVFPAGQLGTEAEMDEGQLDGSIDMRMGSVPFDRMPALQITTAPGLFDTGPQGVATWRGDVANELVWEPMREELGNVFLDDWLLGVHQFTSNVPFTDPESMKGVKMRTPTSDAWVDLIGALGASPQPIAYTETYLALQTGVVDGQSNPLVNIYGANFQEVQEYFIPANLVTILSPMTIREESLSKMSEADQKILFDTAREVGDEVTVTAEKENAELLARVPDDMEVLDADVDAFREAIEKNFLPKYDPIYGEGVWEALREDAENYK